MPQSQKRKNRLQCKVQQNFINLLNYQKNLVSNSSLVAGVDEVGRGALAGPVVAACVILDLEKCPVEVNDSKLLSPEKRKILSMEIKKTALSFGIGMATKDEIEDINIKNASLLAMKRALLNMQVQPELILVDGNCSIETNVPQKTVINGDALCVSIAAASIVAKVTRDELMCEIQTRYPGFSFHIHKGYGTKKHFEEIKTFGPTEIHRPSFIKRVL